MSKLREAISIMAAVELELRSAVLGGENLDDQEEAVKILRQVYANAVTVVAWLIDQDERLRDNPALGAEFRRRFTEMRTTILDFQTRWPPAALVGEQAKFEQEATDLVASNSAFIEWVDHAYV